ncbi:hypothetical protein AAFF_G00304210 [Aldrovandia affinis]|uniref:Uncharacterized protein n=1 Tax=Aldrovandia affinis TaxID=143900 RepID=A0AAD7SP53_9TELE|nr:hypothetical protein AAFF_G00304210 [Aldrovandia affinis]
MLSIEDSAWLSVCDAGPARSPSQIHAKDTSLSTRSGWRAEYALAFCVPAAIPFPRDTSRHCDLARFTGGSERRSFSRVQRDAKNSGARCHLQDPETLRASTC